ncbi:MAG TPA: hypothetical protein VKB12_18755 [Pyrinomonadaceae bacterium]|nr:hypothetical protein [Pyrinomonadaceae bacterium]
MANTADNAQDELARRHGAAARAVFAAFLFTLLLVALAFVLAPRVSLAFDPTLANSLRIAIVFMGIGAVYFRRTKFSAMRLRDIAALRGTSGLLQTLQRTTVLVALIGAGIAALGFYISLMTGDGKDMLYLGVIAAAVLLYCYPRRAAWASVVNATAEPSGGAEDTAKGTIA